MTAPLSLDHIRSLHAGITSGPWRWDEKYGDEGDTGLALTNDVGVEIVGAYNHHCCSFRDDPIVEDNDAAFITAAPSMVAHLLGIVDAQQAKLDKVAALAESPDQTLVKAKGDKIFYVEAHRIRAAITREGGA